MKWIFNKDKPIYSQIIEQIQLFIVSGALSPGDRLKTVRELAQDAGVNPNTMQRALSELERIGLVYTNRTSGRYITEDSEIIENIKISIAQNYVNAFLENMKNMGYSSKDIIEFIYHAEEGKENNE